MTNEEAIELVKEDKCCDCLTKHKIKIINKIIGYDRELKVELDFKNKKIFTWYDYKCGSGYGEELSINFCPLCGRKLD